ncbi:hypothetical protein ABZW38_24155 [Streptomyces bacillaris]|uniref:hypothetical protein n=1 Tax=Streptomyces bacillaris TaxID=68179 RepID=UPI00345F4F91
MEGQGRRSRRGQRAPPLTPTLNQPAVSGPPVGDGGPEGESLPPPLLSLITIREAEESLHPAGITGGDQLGEAAGLLDQALDIDLDGGTRRRCSSPTPPGRCTSWTR